VLRTLSLRFAVLRSDPTTAFSFFTVVFVSHRCLWCRRSRLQRTARDIDYPRRRYLWASAPVGSHVAARRRVAASRGRFRCHRVARHQCAHRTDRARCPSGCYVAMGTEGCAVCCLTRPAEHRATRFGEVARPNETGSHTLSSIIGGQIAVAVVVGVIPYVRGRSRDHLAGQQSDRSTPAGAAYRRAPRQGSVGRAGAARRPGPRRTDTPITRTQIGR
jgi:hypothetical protein